MKRIIFDSRNWLCKINSDIHKHLTEHKSKDFEPFSVFHNRKEAKHYLHLSNVLVLNDIWYESNLRFSFKALADYVIKFNLEPIWQLIHSDRFLRKCTNEDEIYRYVFYYIFAWEKIFKKVSPDILISESPVGIWNYVAFKLAEYFNTLYLGYLPTRSKDGFYFAKDIFGKFPELENRYRSINKIDLDEKIILEKFISDTINQKKIPGYVKKTLVPKKIVDIINPLHILKYYINNFRYRNDVIGDITFDKRNDQNLENIKQFYRSNFIRLFNLCGKKKMHMNSKYFLFALHYQPELTTDIWATYYSDQLYLIKQIAKALPFGYYLYVKEHKSFLGYRQLNYYKKIKEIQNVKLIHPLSDTFELIKNSVGVITITGTIGLEAILFEKPVLIFGNVFYDFFEEIIKVRELEKLPELINLAVEKRSNDHEKTLKFVKASIASGYNLRLDEYSGTDEEIKILIDAITEEFLNKQKKIKI